MAGTKKAAKDLAAKSAKVKGGRLSANDNLTLVRAAKPAKKDLAPKSSKPVKGGRIGVNDNLTLVRAAKPAKKDLPAGTDVKAGKKAAR